MRKVKYKIGNSFVDYNLEGKVTQGKDEVLLEKDINLLQNSDFNNEGYSIHPFLSEEMFTKIKSGITDIIKSLLIKVGCNISSHFTLEKYHTYVSDEEHLKLAMEIQNGWNVSEFPVDFKQIDERMSELLDFEVTTFAPHINYNNFFLRIIRPNKLQDNNPPHRDVWIDRLRNAINIYAPICGSNKNSSLPIMPSTHMLSESKIQRSESGAILNGIKYTVPCALFVNNDMLEMVRPDVKENEIMIFSPYLIHGGGANLNEDVTRISLEVRFFPKNIDLLERYN